MSTVAQLREELSSLGADTSGNKKELQARLAQLKAVAPPAPAVEDIAKLSVKELRARLEALGADKSGNKAVLVARLSAAGPIAAGAGRRGAPARRLAYVFVGMRRSGTPTISTLKNGS